MNEGVWKSFGYWLWQAQSPGRKTIFFSPTLTSTTLSHRGGKLERKIFAPTLKGEIFLNCKGRKIVYCYLSFEITTESALWIWCCLLFRNWMFTARNKLAKWSKQILRLRSGCWALGILGLETVFVKLNEIMVTDKNKILNSHFEEENIRFLIEFVLFFI